MTPLPSPFGNSQIVGWRLDQARHASTWDSGIGAYEAGGRWNSRGVAAVYCSLDPATAILEVAVHKGFEALDTIAHVVTHFVVLDPADVHVVDAGSIANINWLRPGIPGAGQQAFGNALLARHKFVLIPSSVSTHSWNLIFDGKNAAGRYVLKSQEPFALDTRLNPVRR